MSAGTCQQCGAPVAEGALFCMRCGVDVSAVHPGEAATVEMASLGSPAPRVRATMRQMLRDATLGDYEILSELGRGGMATVFLAHDISLDRKVAIKVMAPHLLEGEGMAERFKLEARTAAQLSHPHIIPIYAVKETEDTLFFVMKYVEGRPLDEIIKKTGPLPIPMVKEILAKVGSALGYAHRREVIHRDIKPANIMIDDEGAPIVTDFGIAKVSETKGLTMTGTTIGTPSYMSPEQCEARQVTGASDQYSLGVVAFEMLTGRVPFAGDSAVTTMYKHCHEPPPPLQDFRPDCPPEVLETVTRMLAKAPAERWPSLEAAVGKLGASTESQLDPIRSHLMELARETDPRELLAQLRTPRTPMPAVSGPGRAVTAPLPAPRRSRGLVAAGIVVLAVGAGTLAVLKPWEGASPTSLVVEGGGATPTGPADGTDSAALGTDGGGQPAGGGASEPATEPAPRPVDAPASRPPAGGTTTPDRPAGGGAARPTEPAGPAPVASVRIAGLRDGLEPGEQVSLSASPMDARGGSTTGSPARWTSSDESVATVSTAGAFTAVAPGSVLITATIDGVSARETVEVAAAAVVAMGIDPTGLTLTAGERSALAADVRGRRGPLSGRPVSWSSSDASVASVSAVGEVTAQGPGQATITATSGGISATARVTVSAPVVDTRTAIEQVITDYARALESGDINAVRRAYPGMTPDQERQTSGALRSMERANLRVVSVSEQGDVATADVSGTYDFLNEGRVQQVPVTFRATFEQGSSGWRMTQIR